MLIIAILIFTAISIIGLICSYYWAELADWDIEGWTDNIKYDELK